MKSTYVELTSLPALTNDAAHVLKVTPVNMICRHILRDVIIGEYPEYSIDCRKLCISKGIKSLNRLECPEARLLPGFIFQLQWKLSDMSTHCPVKDDTVHVLLYSEWRDDFAVFKNAGICGDLSICLPLPSKFAGEALHCWVFITRDDGKMASVSEYLGEIM